MRWRVTEAAEAMGSRWSGGAERTFRGAAIDSRQVRGGELFFALRGDRVDGHDYLDAALAAGAVAVVVDRPDVLASRADVAIRVPDVYAALHDLTRAVRRRVPEHLVAITGSAGKTTTKELLADCLASRYRVARNPGNLNNLYGFPLALLGIPNDTEWMVAEMGMSTPRELAGVSRLGRADVAVFLNVRPVHLEALGDLDAVMEAKAELLEGLAPGAVVVANAEDERVRTIAGRHDGEIVWFGGDSEVRVEDSRPRGDGSADLGLRLGGRTLAIRWRLLGKHNLENLAAAAACAWFLGVEPEAIVAAAEAFEPVAGRGRVLRQGRLTVVDESYNSNPEALALSMEAAARLPGEARWAVLGSMLELGERSPQFHREAGRRAADLFDTIVAVGEEARPLAEAAESAGGSARWMPDASEAARYVEATIPDGAVLLVKGSRGIGLEAVVEALLDGEGV